jgi:Domain of unknown function (DUF4282)
MMLQDFLKFDQYLTPTIIRIFYFLQVALVALFGLVGLLSGIMAMIFSSVVMGFLWIVATAIGVAIGIFAARILTEVIMVLFQNNEHLAAMRARMDGH